MADDFSTIDSDAFEHAESPSPVAKVTEAHKAGVYATELAHAEQQLAQLQKRLALVTIDAASGDKSSLEDLEILLETRGLIRYACFRIGRARRMREQQYSTQSPNSSPSKILTRRARNWGQVNGSLDRLRSSDFGSSTTTLDAYEDDESKRRQSLMTDYQIQEDHGNAKPSRSEHMSGRTISFKPTERMQHMEAATVKQESGAIDSMISTMEEDVNTLLYQIFSSIYESLLSIWSLINSTTGSFASRAAILLRNAAFQALMIPAIALVSYRLLVAYDPAESLRGPSMPNCESLARRIHEAFEEKANAS